MTEKNCCNFCGKGQSQVSRLFPGPPTWICNECVDRMAAALDGRAAAERIRLRDELEQAVADSFSRMVANLHLGELHERYQHLVKVKFKEGPESPSFQEVFGEFKRGVEEVVREDDYQTRYDLGIAYSEMGLYQDALHELGQSLKHALWAKDYSRAREILSALLFVPVEAAQMMRALTQCFGEVKP